MRLDVILPTYNRQDLLPLALNSLFAAEVPAGLEVSITVIDNNSTDGTRSVIESFQQRFGDRIHYCFERKQGRSHALNAGIAATTGEFIGVMDDDEEIGSTWFTVVYEAFKNKELDFIGGPLKPIWTIAPPDWLPHEYGGVIGWVDAGDKEVPYDSNYPGILMGGNAVFKRTVLEQVGGYTTWLGRTDKGLLTGEDEELYGRLLAHGAKGMYLPGMMVQQHVPNERMTKSYFRRWCFWRGVSLGLLDRTRRRPVAYLFGIPRWHYRKAFRGMLSTTKHLVVKPKEPSQAFAAELGIWDWLGLLYGRHLRRASTR
jgi:glucosyl-dolichyl phosphate glucuronosyltransferase